MKGIDTMIHPISESGYQFLSKEELLAIDIIAGRTEELLKRLSDINIQKFASFVIKNGIYCIVHDFFSKMVPGNAKAKIITLLLQSLYESNIIRYKQHQSAYFKFQNILAKNHIKFVLLKGIAVAEAVYFPAHLRVFSDMDILIHTDDIDKTYEILFKHYKLTDDFGSRDEVFHSLETMRRQYSHLVSIYDDENDIGIELHHTYQRPNGLDYLKLYGRSASCNGIESPDLIGLFIHSCTHMLNDYEPCWRMAASINIQLRNIIDIKLLYDKINTDGHYHALMERAEQWNVKKHVCNALNIVSTVFDDIKIECDKEDIVDVDLKTDFWESRFLDRLFFQSGEKQRVSDIVGAIQRRDKIEVPYSEGGFDAFEDESKMQAFYFFQFDDGFHSDFEWGTRASIFKPFFDDIRAYRLHMFHDRKDLYFHVNISLSGPASDEARALLRKHSYFVIYTTDDIIFKHKLNTHIKMSEYDDNGILAVQNKPLAKDDYAYDFHSDFVMPLNDTKVKITGHEKSMDFMFCIPMKIFNVLADANRFYFDFAVGVDKRFLMKETHAFCGAGFDYPGSHLMAEMTFAAGNRQDSP